ncbi:FAD-dependent oxidoreductase [Actinobacteria bacterium YIM 96077]|uniref:L-2-hydroxyglutarate oxidase n=1 Tax=Phytoactinopolyspora halophila TaxID=1981511 RepID=A0A329QEN9_9ACTN|nr:FAD-dependent oxidoreductase [Phytoactinopolyspora halophila]AYY14046.1 FAD-dependent oxidoreductase [Actinobacteria bacterium YIM 96077]RAW10953.1 L-2-hydroxyglutarate oxidase [Phytoactinopolyspora halophila]
MNAGRRYGIIGAGIIGAAVARAILRDDDAAQVTVLEKETEPGLHQTGRNSGVVHAGLYYTPGSAKARFARRGIPMLREYCEEHGLAYDECGKVLVALDERDSRRLRDIEARAHANGVPGVRWLTGSQLPEVEPHVRGVAGLHSPTTAIVDFAAVTRAMLDEAVRAGARVRTGVEVTGFDQTHDEVRVRAAAAPARRRPGSPMLPSHPGRSGGDARRDGNDTIAAFDHVIICAGLHADRLARLAGDDEFPRIVPFRGEFALLRPERRHLVNALVYPVPDPRYPFLGVHFTPRVDGEVLVGPNAVLALAREGYHRRDLDVHQARELVAWPGFRRFARANWRTGVREVYGSLNRRAFARAARRYVPDLRAGDLVATRPGIRAQAMDADGTLVDDFRINQRGRILCVRNAPSPAATASLAIADDILATLTPR